MENKKFQISVYGVIITMIVITAIIIFAFSGPLETSHKQVYNKKEMLENE